MNTKSVGQCNATLQNRANIVQRFQPGIATTRQADIRIKSLLTEMLKVLDLEFGQYHNLLELLHDQRSCFSRGDIESFERIGKQQETVVLKIKMLEEARRRIISRLARYYSVPPDECTLTMLNTLVDDPYRRQIERCKDEAQSIIGQLEAARDGNAYLIRHALHHVTGVLKIFASVSACEPESSSGQIT